MELDRVLYIFGSFTRKRQDKRRSLEPCSLSVGSSPLHRQHRSLSRPASTVKNGDLIVPPRTSAYKTVKICAREWECGLCGHQLSEPRVLSCLHHFCTRCLQGLQQEGEEGWNDVHTTGNQVADEGHSGGGSAGSGYESDPRNHSSDGSWGSEHREKSLRYGILTRKISGKSVQLLQCPTCGCESPLPLGGISALPLNSMLLRKMVANEVEEEKANVLCDLCTSDTKAESRCSQCLVSVCRSCSEVHSRQKETKRHSQHPLKHTTVQYCNQHPTSELCIYCATCQQVICRDCCLLLHCGHAFANCSRAAAERGRLLRDACVRAKSVPRQVEKATRTLRAHARDNDLHASKVESEVSAWAEEYRLAVEAHGRSLCAAASRARTRYHQKVAERNKELQDYVEHAELAVKFAEELLSEGREDEILYLSNSVLRRLERVSDLSTVSVPPSCDLRFVSTSPEIPLVGRLLTHTPDLDKCVVHTESLQDLRVGEDHSVVMEVVDSGGDRIWCGGELVAAFIRRRDSSARPDSAKVQDRGDGSYSITVKPKTPGAYLLAITLNNKPIKGSPFPCAARVSKVYNGQECAENPKRKGCNGQTCNPATDRWSRRGASKRPSNVRQSHQTYQFSL